jgi:hypothetical protein
MPTDERIQGRKHTFPTTKYNLKINIICKIKTKQKIKSGRRLY